MTDYTPTQQQQIKQLEAKLIEKPQSDYAYTAFAAYAGRLAALGIEKYIRQLETWLKELPAEKRNQIFLQRFDEGLDDLTTVEDEELGCVVTEAQDFWCFKNHTTLTFSDSVLARLHQWCEEAEYAPLNAEAVDFIKEWKDSFPIPEAEMLLSVSVPLDEEMEDVLHAMAFPNEGKTVTAMAEDWSTKIYCKYRIAGPVLSVNKGLLLLEKTGEEEWSARWSDMPYWTPEMLKKQPLHVQFMDGSRAFPTILSRINPLRAKRFQTFESHLVAAASEDSRQRLNLKWESSDASVTLYLLVHENNATLNWKGQPLAQIKLDTQTWDVADGQNLLQLAWSDIRDSLLAGLPLEVRPQGSNTFLVLETKEESTENEE